MSHEHETCATPKPGGICNEGMLLGYCDDDCPYADCTVIGHCDCGCHSGKTCGCGYVWPRMPKKEKITG